MSILKSQSKIVGNGEHKFPLLFSNRIPTQLNQGKLDRDEGSIGNIQEIVDGDYSMVDEKHVSSAYSVHSGTTGSQLESFCSISFEVSSNCWQFDVRTVTQSSLSPSISCIHDVPRVSEVSRITSADSNSSHDNSAACEVLRDVHISARLMEDFIELARDNTNKNLETCGLLGASLEEGTFYVTTLIIPKQESTSDSCQALNEEEIFAIQNEQSLFPVGWIHTHPTQSCFMSSIDLHTQYSYQVMVPEAVAIVVAPTDKSRGYGIFRLSDPGGMSILEECKEREFHAHKESDDGSSIYGHCANVYVNPNIRLEIRDLR